MAGELGVEHGLGQRPQHQAVVRGDQMDRRPHHDDPHDLALHQQPPELVGIEGPQARPQGHVGVARLLGLEAHQVRHRVARRQVRAIQQELAREGRPAERARAEDLGRHGRIFSPR